MTLYAQVLTECERLGLRIVGRGDEAAGVGDAVVVAHPNTSPILSRLPEGYRVTPSGRHHVLVQGPA